jgi:signal transduction histidine kinase
MSGDTDFAHIVSLACHDLRTPLATVAGFAQTLATSELGDRAGRYVELMEAAAQQMRELLDDVALLARIEAGTYEPTRVERSTGDLADTAAEQAGDGVTAATVLSTPIEVDAAAVSRALASLARASLRHGDVPAVTIRADGRTFRVGPVDGAAAPVVLARTPVDLGAAVARRVLAAAGARVELEGADLVVRL